MTTHFQEGRRLRDDRQEGEEARRPTRTRRGQGADAGRREEGDLCGHPQDQITKVVYERPKHRWHRAVSIVNPLLFFSSWKKHWLTIEFAAVARATPGHQRPGLIYV